MEMKKKDLVKMSKKLKKLVKIVDKMIEEKKKGGTM
jgi:hypothetical protein